MSLSDVENAVMSHFATNWGIRTEINWSAMNVSFRTNALRTSYTDNDTYIIPKLQMVSADYLEHPANNSVKKFDYQFILNLVTTPNLGMGHLQGHVNAIRDLLELKTITLSGTEVYFEAVRTQSGFLSESGDVFELPVSIFFTTYL